MKGKIISALVALIITLPVASLSTNAMACGFGLFGSNRCCCNVAPGYWTHGYYTYGYYYGSGSYYGNGYGYACNCGCPYKYGYCNPRLKGGALAGVISHRIRSNPCTACACVRVIARGHKVILCGFARDFAQKQIILNIARYTCGVCVVVDGIGLQQP